MISLISHVRLCNNYGVIICRILCISGNNIFIVYYKNSFFFLSSSSLEFKGNDFNIFSSMLKFNDFRR